MPIAFTLPGRERPLTQQQQNDLFMLSVDDDTEEAPWMVMGDPQFWSASAFAHSLRIHAQEQGLPWYIAAMLPIRYDWPGAARKKQVAPDVLVSFVDDHVRSSYDVAVEGRFPAFVLEVVSPSSVFRDEVEKLNIYDLLGAAEYVLYTPDAQDTPLQGYRRSGTGGLEVWPLQADGTLWSDVLQLTLVVTPEGLQGRTPQGELLRTPAQEAEARRQAEAARRQAEAAQREEAEARLHAEEEVALLRAELQRYKQNDET